MATGLSANQKCLHPGGSPPTYVPVSPPLGTRRPAWWLYVEKGRNWSACDWSACDCHSSGTQKSRSQPGRSRVKRGLPDPKGTNCSLKLKECCLLSVWWVWENLSVLNLIKPAKGLLKLTGAALSSAQGGTGRQPALGECVQALPDASRMGPACRSYSLSFHGEEIAHLGSSPFTEENEFSGKFYIWEKLLWSH